MGEDGRGATVDLTAPRREVAAIAVPQVPLGVVHGQTVSPVRASVVLGEGGGRAQTPGVPHAW